jgi:CHAT domain-containing protein
MLSAGQYLKVIVEQRGVDVVIRLVGPAGKQLTEVDNGPDGTQGMESISGVADTAGEYRLEVMVLDKEAPSGRYQIRIEELREASQKDRTRVAAEWAYAQGGRLRVKATADSLRLSLEKYREALSLWRAADDRDSEAGTLIDMGLSHALLGERQKALEFYGQAILLARSIGNRREEAAALHNIGVTQLRLGKPKEALEAFEKAYALRHDLGDLKAEATTLNSIGGVYFVFGDRQKELQYRFKALEIRRAIGDRLGEAVSLNNVAVVHTLLGQPHKALEYFQESLPLRRAVGDRRGEANTLLNIGTTYRGLGELATALDYMEQALRLRRDLGDRQGQAVTLGHIGVIYRDLGDPSSALTYFNLSLDLNRIVGDRYNESYDLSNIALVYLKLKDFDKALDFLNQALVLRRDVKDGYGEASALLYIGVVYRLKRELPKALDFLNQSLPRLRVVEDRVGEGIALSNIGAIYSSLGKEEEATKHLEQAMVLHRAVGDRLNEAVTLENLARIERDAGRLQEARVRMEAVLEIIESTRAKVAHQDLRVSYLASNQSSYDFYIDLLMRSHKNRPSLGFEAIALQASERARARGLLDMLSEARVDIRQGIDPALLQRAQISQQQLNAASEQLVRLLSGKHTEENAAAARKEVETRLSEYRELRTRMRTGSPRYAALTQPQPLSLKEIQQLLDKDTILLEYALGEERSYLWTVTSTAVTSFELPKRADIERAATRVYEAATARNKVVRFEKHNDKQARVVRADTEYFAESRALSQLVLGPSAGLLGKKRLLIVSDGTLQYIPFGALPIPGRQPSGTPGTVGSANYQPLITEHEIVSLPSASTLAVLRKEMDGRQRGAKTLAVLADPVFQNDDPRVIGQAGKPTSYGSDTPSKSVAIQQSISDIQRSTRDTGETGFQRLPYSRHEAESIMALLPETMSKALLDFDANRTAVTSEELGRYRIIHFATHSFLNNKHPELSGIVLSLVDKEGKPQDGFLRLHEIYNLKLSADLIVLSACRTALGEEVRREGLVGVTRGFMYAGSPRIVASLWAIDDRTTAELMKRFYREMITKQQRPAAALRAAQVSMWREKRMPPYYWAAFALQGEWR